MKRIHLIIVSLLLVLSSCSVYRHVPKEKQLIAKVKLKGAPPQHKEALDLLIEEKSNTKFLGFWRVRTRNWYLSEKWRKRRNKQENTIWEAPIYYTQDGTERTVAKMESYLKNQGYFNAQVVSKKRHKLIRRKAAIVNYKIKENKQYVFNEISRNVEDYDIYVLLQNDRENSLLQKGIPFSSTALTSERERVYKLLRENGYYSFSKSYVYFDLDSTLNNYRVNVSLGVKNPGNYQRHRPFLIGKIHFNKSVENRIDSTQVRNLAPGINRIGEGNKNLDDILLRSLLVAQGDLYMHSKMEASIKNLKKLEQYKYVEVFYENDSTDSDTILLNMSIKLTSFKRWQFQLQTEAISSESNLFTTTESPTLGFGGSLVFRDLNFLKSGILMENRLSGSYESAVIKDASTDENGRRIPFREISLNNSFYFSKPFLAGLLPASIQNNIYQSTININGFLEDNPSFFRSTANISAGYVIQKGRFKHNILPINFSLVSAEITSGSFQNYLDSLSNTYLQNLFENHTIAGSKWGMYYTNKQIGSQRNYVELSANVLELAGSFFNLGASVFGKEAIAERQSTFERTLLGMHFFQYAKFDYDLRFHQKLDKEAEMVYRAFFGVIYPFGNTPNATPFERRYVSGGANSIRGWGIRQVGPGASKSSNGVGDVFSQTGEVKLEGNIEYRFSLSSLVKVALFTDFGNIWEHRDPAVLPENDLRSWNNNWTEIAVAGGVGLRFDFTYFVFRTDIGVPFRDPSVSLTNDVTHKWFYEGNYFRYIDLYTRTLSSNAVQINIGIGYPF